MKNILHFHSVKLDLYKTQNSDQDICSNIEQAEGLTLVALNLKVRSFSGTGLGRLLTNSGSILKELDLGQTDISGAALAGVQLPKLEMLNLSGCSNLTDTGVHELLTTNGSLLKQLRLGGTTISDAALVGVQLPKLEILYLTWCVELTDSGVQELLSKSGGHLTTLYLADTDVSGGMLVDWLEDHAHSAPSKLKVLRLVGCSNVSSTRFKCSVSQN